MKRLILFIVVVLFLGITSQADAILLGQLDFAGTGGGSWMEVSEIDAYGFFLGYDLPPQALPNPLGTYVGITVPISNTITSYDFNASNSSLFSALTSRLTDSTSENLWRLNYFYDYDDQVGGVMGGGGGNTDTYDLGAPTDWQIDFIRLNVDNLYVGPSPWNSGCQYSSSGNWQIWGTGTPISVKYVVPEPASMLLFGAGLMATVFKRRKFK
jgi:hypothetical protein